MDDPIQLAFNYGRRFGVEIELNSFDKRDFVRHPLRKGELPEGIHYVGNLITKLLNVQVEISKWHHTHNNNNWILKPDSSCGIEICSPVSKGWHGLKQVCLVIDAFNKDKNIVADERCSLHVHIETADCNQVQLATILAYWIKCESVFLDSVPASRKRNRYCQCIGLCDLFEHDSQIVCEDMVRILGVQKYYSLNTYHLHRGKRPTIEFRIVESEGCKDAYLVKNWVRLIVHFVEVAKRHPIPNLYKAGDQWSSLLWLDPDDVMSFLGFSGEYELSKGLEQTRNWFLARLKYNLVENKTALAGVWSDKARRIAMEQVNHMVTRLGLEDDIVEALHPLDDVKLYDREYRN